MDSIERDLSTPELGEGLAKSDVVNGIEDISKHKGQEKEVDTFNEQFLPAEHEMAMRKRQEDIYPD